MESRITRMGEGQLETTVSNGLMRSQTLYKVQKKIIPRKDVCDAQFELMRLATNYGSETNELCPICAFDGAKEFLVRVSYVFSSRGGKQLPKWHGKSIVNAKELKDVRKTSSKIKVYFVEVCLICKWNYLLYYKIL
jgi:hypothetical protein